MNEEDEDQVDGTSHGDANDSSVDLAVPAGLMYSDGHVWVEDLDGLWSIGVTQYAEERMGDLVFVDLPDEGTRVGIGDEVVELESSKAVQPLVSPVAGTVRHVNHAVADSPEIINSDPYGEGWVLKIEPEDDEPELLSSEQYAELLNRLK